MNQRSHPAGGDRQPARRVRSGDVGLGVGQRRRRQDPRAGAARDPAAARAAPIRRKSSASPSPRRRRPTWPTASSTRCANGSRSTTTPSTRRSRETGAKPGDKRQRDRARRLFAAALETPGGLKVQTIHGFCTRLLQQFPFEANVPARFRVLEEVEQQQLLEQLRRTMLFEASSNPDSATGRALTAIIPAASDFAFQEGLLEAIRERERLLAWVDHAGGIEQAAAQLSAALGINPDDTLEAVEAEIVDGPHLPSSGWMSVAGICALRIGPRPGSGQAAAERDRRDRPDPRRSLSGDFLHRQRRAARIAHHHGTRQRISRSCAIIG